MTVSPNEIDCSEMKRIETLHSVAKRSRKMTIGRYSWDMAMWKSLLVRSWQLEQEGWVGDRSLAEEGKRIDEKGENRDK